MSSTYEVWLTDDSGKRILLMKDAAFFSYSRVVNGLGTIQLGYPYRLFKEKVNPVFAPDRRLEVWRSPALGYPMRREGIFLIRQEKIYTRETDSVDIIEFFGWSPVDLLSRRWVIQAAGTSYTAKTDSIDDMMKAIVREQMLYNAAVDKDGTQDNTRAYPDLEFTVQADLARGPSISRRFADRNVLDILKELRDTSFQLHEDDPANNRKIYFDVVPRDLSGFELYILEEATGQPIEGEAPGDLLLDEKSGSKEYRVGFQFQTFADLRGSDRTDKLIFSVANSNLKGPFYSRDHNEETNSVIVKGSGRGESRSVVVVNDTSRIDASRWNRNEAIFEASYEVDDSELEDVGAAQLNEGQPKEELFATFLNVPGSEDVPRCLYGIDWDLGDKVRVWYAEQLFEPEIMVVYVGKDENGVETITGRNTIGESV